MINKIIKLTITLGTLGLLLTGCSNLSTMARSGDLDSVKKELDAGTDINFRYKGGGGWTALMGASGGDNFELVKYLVEHGANLNIKDDMGETALFNAAYNQNKKVNLTITKYLIEHGAHINLVNTNGYTALMETARRGNIETMKYLITKGEKPFAKTRNGYYPLNLLVENGYKNNTKEEVYNLVLFYKDLGANLNDTFHDNLTLLHLSQDPKLTQYLIDNGAKINARSKEGLTPLMLPLQDYYRNPNIDVIKVLINNCADLNAQSNDGWNALGLSNRRGFKDISKLLKNAMNNPPQQCSSKSKTKKLNTVVLPKSN